MKTIILTTREMVELKSVLQSRIEEELQSIEECKQNIEECKDKDLKRVFRLLIECSEDEINDCNSILNKILF